VEGGTMSQPIILGEHTWVASATVRLTPQEAKTADRRGHYKTKVDQRIDVLETYCRVCRRRYEDVKSNEPCEVGQVLRGGPIDTRKRREPCEDLEEPRTLRASAG
jgi:hypothetical protein